VNDVPIPEPGENQFLVKMASASLCHSDMLIMSNPDIPKPITIGHEGAGYISKLHPAPRGKVSKKGTQLDFSTFLGLALNAKAA
jgi:propanol-preferring alcohol dehydrogenase